MMVSRLAALIAALLLGLLGPAAAFAKEGVHATLIAPLDLDARPGERITIAWTLEDAQGRPFGASGLFVRLRNAADGRAVTTVTDGNGRFAVQVTVPDGGIGRIEFGLRGWRTVGGRTSRADMLFPLENDPFARSPTQPVEAPRSASPSASSKDDPLPPWIIPVVVMAAVSVIVAAGVRSRRQPASERP